MKYVSIFYTVSTSVLLVSAVCRNANQEESPLTLNLPFGINVPFLNRCYGQSATPTKAPLPPVTASLSSLPFSDESGPESEQSSTVDKRGTTVTKESSSESEESPNALFNVAWGNMDGHSVSSLGAMSHSWATELMGFHDEMSSSATSEGKDEEESSMMSSSSLVLATAKPLLPFGTDSASSTSASLLSSLANSALSSMSKAVDSLSTSASLLSSAASSSTSTFPKSIDSSTLLAVSSTTSIMSKSIDSSSSHADTGTTVPSSINSPEPASTGSQWLSASCAPGTMKCTKDGTGFDTCVFGIWGVIRQCGHGTKCEQISKDSIACS